MALTPDLHAGRRPATLTGSDLRRLAIVAHLDREHFFAAHPRWRRLYGDRLLCTVLSQAATEDDARDPHDDAGLTLWSFYREHPDAPLPHRRKRVWPGSDRHIAQCLGRPIFRARPVEVVCRSILGGLLDDPAATLRQYVDAGATSSARRLRERRLVLLEPVRDQGRIVWPVPGAADRAATEPAPRSRWRKP